MLLEGPKAAKGEEKKGWEKGTEAYVNSIHLSSMTTIKTIFYRGRFCFCCLLLLFFYSNWSIKWQTLTQRWWIRASSHCLSLHCFISPFISHTLTHSGRVYFHWGDVTPQHFCSHPIQPAGCSETFTSTRSYRSISISLQSWRNTKTSVDGWAWQILNQVPAWPELSCETFPPCPRPTSWPARVHQSPPPSPSAQTPCISGRKTTKSRTSLII